MKIKKYINLVLVAGSIVFTFTGCGKEEAPTESPVAIEQTTDIAVEDNGVADVDLIENADDITDGQTSVTEETVTLSYMKSGNGEYELENQQETTIEEYKMEKPLEELVGSEVDIEINEEMIAETRDDGNIVVSADDLEIKSGYTLQYSYDTKTKEGKAIYMYQYLTWDGMDESEIPASGINVVLEKAEDKYVIKGFEDIFGNDITEIQLYRGEVIGWACGTENAIEADFEFEDKARFSTDMELYPVLDVEYEVIDESIFKEIQHSYVVGIYGHKVPKQQLTGDNSTKGIYHVQKDVDGKVVLVTDEGGKVDPATGENPKQSEPETKTGTTKSGDNGKTTTPGGGGSGNGGETTPKTPGEGSTPAWTPDPQWGNGPTFGGGLPVDGGGGATGGIQVE